MTDGECEFPEISVKRILSDPLLVKKIQFRGILYGDTNDQSPNTLKEMCNRLSGVFESTISVEDLTKSFSKLIPNLYAGQ